MPAIYYYDPKTDGNLPVKDNNIEYTNENCKFCGNRIGRSYSYCTICGLVKDKDSVDYLRKLIYGRNNLQKLIDLATEDVIKRLVVDEL